MQISNTSAVLAFEPPNIPAYTRVVPCVGAAAALSWPRATFTPPATGLRWLPSFCFFCRGRAGAPTAAIAAAVASLVRMPVSCCSRRAALFAARTVPWPVPGTCLVAGLCAATAASLRATAAIKIKINEADADLYMALHEQHRMPALTICLAQPGSATHVHAACCKVADRHPACAYLYHEVRAMKQQKRPASQTRVRTLCRRLALRLAPGAGRFTLRPRPLLTCAVCSFGGRGDRGFVHGR